jgi:hypothetical protein
MKSNDWRVSFEGTVWSEREAKWVPVWGCDRNAVIWVIENRCCSGSSPVLEFGN